MAVTLEQFVQQLTQSGLMSATEVISFQDTLPPQHKPKDAEGLARELVRANKLTRYQAAAVYHGEMLAHLDLIPVVGEDIAGLSRNPTIWFHCRCRWETSPCPRRYLSE